MTYEMEFVDLSLQHTAVVYGHLATGEIASFIGAAFGEVIASLDGQGLHPTGPPFGRYRPTGEGQFDVEIGFPCSGVVKPSGRVEPSELPAGRAAHTMHVGAYDGIGAAYEAVIGWLTDQGH